MEITCYLLAYHHNGFQRWRPEKCESYNYQGKCEHYIECLYVRAAAHALGKSPYAPDSLVKHQQKTVICAPDNVHPRRTMPQTAENHRYKLVEVCSEFTFSVASEGYVQIIAQPQLKRYVPAAPKFGRILRLEWSIKIYFKPVSEHKGKSYGHIRISGEITI